MKNILSTKKFLNLFVAVAIFMAAFGFTSVAAAQSTCGATYTVKRGDYLMKIARTCGVSYSDLLKANPWITNPSRIYAGQVLNIPSGESPLRIRFASGGTSAALTGTIPASLSQSFILGAAKGQTLNVTATPQDKLQLTIYGVDGTVLRSGMGEGASYTGVLPSTQDYILTLKSTNQGQAFTLNVSIPALSTPPVSSSDSYTVKRGDTLLKIAQRFQTTVNVLLRANPDITNRNVITVGQVIYLPGATLTFSNGQVVYIAKSSDTMGAIARQFNTTLSALISANPKISNPNLIYPGQRINIP